jgi:hypothetical protein
VARTDRKPSSIDGRKTGVIEAEDRAFLLDPQNKPGAMPIQLPVKILRAFVDRR